MENNNILVPAYQSSELLDQAVSFAFEFADMMSAEDRVTLRSMCSPAFWEQYGDGVVRTLGGQFSDFVNAETLPIEHAGKNSSNARLYRRR